MKKAAAAAAFLTVTVFAAGTAAGNGNFGEAVNAETQIEDGTESSAEEMDTSFSVLPGSRIAVVSKCVDGQFWDMVYQGMDAAVKDINEAYGLKANDQIKMTFEGPEDEQNVEEQVNTLDAVIAENPAVLCLSASDMNSCQAQLETAMENDIPVIVFDSNVREDQLITAFRGTDNERVGAIAGEKMAGAMNQEGTVLVFSAQEKTESNQKRVSGFKAALAKYPDIEIAEEIYSDQVEDMGMAMKEALEKNPEVKGVFCTNADMSDLYLSLEQEDQELPLMIGVDATTKQQDAVKNGKEYGIVSQDPYHMGYETIMAAAHATDPENPQLEKNVLLEPAWIDETNIEDPEFRNYIYQ